MKTQQTKTTQHFKLSAIQAVLATTLLVPALSYANEAATAGSSNNASNAIETMVVTANRTPQDLSSVLTSVEIFTRDDIEITSSVSLAEILNKVNGLQITTNGGAGQSASVFTRGTDSGHTLVVIDGQRISSATLGQTPFAAIPPEQIERIEIIKGPRAALWGSDAIGGVIQIFTRQLSGGEVVASAAVGNDDFMQGSASAGISHGDGSTTITVSSESSNGYDVRQDEETDDDGYSRENISVVGLQQLSANWKLNWLSKYDQGVTETDTTWGGNKGAFENYQLQAGFEHQTDDWFQSLSVGKQQNESNTYGNGIPESEGDVFKTTRLEASWLGSYQFNDVFSSTVGVDFINEEVNELSENGETERDNTAVFTRVAYNNSTWILDASVRYDDIEHVDSEVSYNASVGYVASNDTLVSLNYGTGFKAPSFNDLYYDAYGSVGNVNLKHETSESVELLVNTTIESVDAQLSVYQTKVDDLIEWVEFAPYQYTPENISKATIKGMELTLNANFFDIDHEVQWAYLDATDDTDDSRLIRRAKNTASYHLSKGWDRLTVQASIQYQGRREDSSRTLSSNTLVNMSSTYQVNDAWNVSFKMNNALDKKYDSLNGYTGQPAQYLLGVTYKH